MSSCIHKNVCSGCPWIDFSAQEQKNRKISVLSESLLRTQIHFQGEIRHHLPGEFFLRDRADLTYENGKYGFYQKDSRAIFAVKSCPQMSPALQNLFDQLIQISLPIKKGSLRLRVSAAEDSDSRQKNGLWLDFANEDVKNLFEEKVTLHRLMELGHVEVGQRRKSLIFNEAQGRFQLLESQYHPWTQTWQGATVIPLYSLVGSFTQTGNTANQALVMTMEDLLTRTTAQRWVEFGCGNGNLTLPLAGSNRQVLGVEFDEASLEGLKRTLSSRTDLQNRISLQSGDFQKKKSLDFSTLEGILVNPPRSGLGHFLEPLVGIERKPQDLIYMSCFMDSFIKDGIQIQSLGYQLKELVIVDQFPQTPHFEILSRWKI